MNLNNSQAIIKRKYVDQEAGDGLGNNPYHGVEIYQSAAQFHYILREISNRVRRRGCQWI